MLLIPGAARGFALRVLLLGIGVALIGQRRADAACDGDRAAMGHVTAPSPMARFRLPLVLAWAAPMPKPPIVLAVITPKVPSATQRLLCFIIVITSVWEL